MLSVVGDVGAVGVEVVEGGRGGSACSSWIELKLHGRKWNFGRPRTPVPSFAVCRLWHH